MTLQDIHPEIFLKACWNSFDKATALQLNSLLPRWTCKSSFRGCLILLNTELQLSLISYKEYIWKGEVASIYLMKYQWKLTASTIGVEKNFEKLLEFQSANHCLAMSICGNNWRQHLLFNKVGKNFERFLTKIR